MENKGRRKARWLEEPALRIPAAKRSPRLSGKLDLRTKRPVSESSVRLEENRLIGTWQTQARIFLRQFWGLRTKLDLRFTTGAFSHSVQVEWARHERAWRHRLQKWQFVSSTLFYQNKATCLGLHPRFFLPIWSTSRKTVSPLEAPSNPRPGPSQRPRTPPCAPNQQPAPSVAAPTPRLCHSRWVCSVGLYIPRL